MKKVKMITEASYDLNINESEDKKLYVEGIFAVAEKKNANKRVYGKDLLSKQVNKYITEKVERKQSLCEINHPTDRCEIDLTKAAGLVESLEWRGNDVWGRALVLPETPYGSILNGLIKSGVSVGISTRGTGTVSESGYVDDSYNLITWDFVSSPSAPGAFVNGILEGVDFPVPDTNETKQPTDEEVKQALQEHEKRIWQVIKQIENSL